jgi:hypothetical protein
LNFLSDLISEIAINKNGINEKYPATDKSNKMPCVKDFKIFYVF